MQSAACTIEYYGCMSFVVIKNMFTVVLHHQWSIGLKETAVNLAL